MDNHYKDMTQAVIIRAIFTKTRDRQEKYGQYLQRNETDTHNTHNHGQSLQGHNMDNPYKDMIWTIITKSRHGQSNQRHDMDNHYTNMTWTIITQISHGQSLQKHDMDNHYKDTTWTIITQT
jgi:hypothetical protein